MENVEAAAVKHVRLAPILRESGLAKLTASAPSAKSVLGHEADRQAKFPNARNGSGCDCRTLHTPHALSIQHRTECGQVRSSTG